jgi:predicted ester cyclase
MYRAAFPDAHITIEDIVAEGNQVVIRWTARGTHTGNLGRIPPRGEEVTVTGIDLVRISKGKVQENWTNWDTLGILQQLGVQQVAAAGV